jgi:hypothetical protein
MDTLSNTLKAISALLAASRRLAIVFSLFSIYQKHAEYRCVGLFSTGISEAVPRISATGYHLVEQLILSLNLPTYVDQHSRTYTLHNYLGLHTCIRDGYDIYDGYDGYDGYDIGFILNMSRRLSPSGIKTRPSPTSPVLVQ